MKKTWGDIYNTAKDRGEDPGYAAHLADEWEKRRIRDQSNDFLSLQALYIEKLNEVRMAKEALTKASRFIRSIYKVDVVDELTCEDLDDTERSVGAALDYLNR